MILDRIAVDCDLSEAGVEEALTKCYGLKKTLVVGAALLNVGKHLAFKYKLVLQLNTELPRDAWYVHAEYNGIFSPGA